MKDYALNSLISKQRILIISFYINLPLKVIRKDSERSCKKHDN